MRIFELLELEFKAKKLRIEEEIEIAINDKGISIEDRVKNLIVLFDNLATLELAYKKYREYLPNKEE